MLDTVKSFIENDLPSISFEQYFIQYILKLQDENIDAEISTLLRNPTLSPEQICNLVEHDIEEMKGVTPIGNI